MTFSITKLIRVDYLLNIIAAILYATRCRLFGGRSVCNEMESGTDHGGGALRFCLHGKDVCEIQIGIIKITHQEKLFGAEEKQSFRGAKAASVLVRLFLLGEKIVRTHTQRFFSLLTTSWVFYLQGRWQVLRSPSPFSWQRPRRFSQSSSGQLHPSSSGSILEDQGP